MDRYQYVKQIKSDSGKRIYSTSKYPVIERSETDIYIYARQGMRLDNLAFKYYGDAGAWWRIALANNLGKGTLIVPIGQQIRIPMINITTGELDNSQNNK